MASMGSALAGRGWMVVASCAIAACGGIEQSTGESLSGASSGPSNGASSGAVAAPVDGASSVSPAPARGPSRWANWPVPNPPSTQLRPFQSYDTSQPGVVRDLVTGLEWLSAVSPGMTHDATAAYCAGLTDAGGGWRVPSRIELVSIVDSTQSSSQNAAFGLPASHPVGWGSPAPGTFTLWSSSPLAGDSTRFWAVTFGAAPDTPAGALPASQSQYVRCVRGGAADPATRFVVDGDVVHDTQTKLRWERAGSATAVHADGPPLSDGGTHAYCNGRRTGGLSGWRLPTVNELETLVDETRSAPAADLGAFPDTQSDFYMTQSPYEAFPGYYDYVSFTYGVVVVQSLAGSAYARCVLPE